MRNHAFYLFSLAALLSLFCSCGDPAVRKPETATPTAEAEVVFAKLYPEWKPAPQSDYGLRKKDYDPILHGISREQYGNLDPFVKRFEETYRDGKKVKEVFLNCFEKYHRIGGSGARRWMPNYEENLRKWIEMKPDSVAPYLALAGIIKSQAWLSRGEGWASEVTEEGWKGFYENLDRSQRQLEESPDFVKEDAHYWFQRLIIGLGKGAEHEEMFQIFREGQKRDPLYLPLYEQTVWYLQPRWHGEEPDDWHDFLVEAIQAENLSEEDRKWVYGMIVRYCLRGEELYERSPSRYFEVMGIDTGKFLQGLAIQNERYPESTAWPTHYLYHAVRVGDVDAMKEATEMADRTFDPQSYPEETLLGIFESLVETFPEMAEVLGRSG